MSTHLGLSTCFIFFSLLLSRDHTLSILVNSALWLADELWHLTVHEMYFVCYLMPLNCLCFTYLKNNYEKVGIIPLFHWIHFPRSSTLVPWQLDTWFFRWPYEELWPASCPPPPQSPILNREATVSPHYWMLAEWCWRSLAIQQGFCIARWSHHQLSQHVIMGRHIVES